jgi:hypothetical protein
MSQLTDKHLTDISDGVRSINNKLCENGSSASQVEVINDCTKPIPVFFCNTETKLDPEVVCLSNDGGVSIIKGWEVFDVSTNPPTSKFYIGGVEVTGYSVIPCSSNIKDREIITVCVDGKEWTKVIVFEADLPVSFLWLDETDAPVATPDPLLINNIKCLPLQQIGIEQYSGLSNTTQNSTFSANEVTITYDTSTFTTSPLTITLISSNALGSKEFKVQPNTQETRKFKYPVITGVIISGAVDSNVTVEFQLN